ncbi:hypothetical protein TNCT_154421 [Trichonephila clavata]|uniref:Uncharacterized protein n=1 Tax=Trichonephila clavata TaxID=2740835 RepID=A0A8X6G6E4_TRICU|nr:hypothetical protein TNCT_154421 [Trichonephila clavata]
MEYAKRSYFFHTPSHLARCFTEHRQVTPLATSLQAVSDVGEHSGLVGLKKTHNARCSKTFSSSSDAVRNARVSLPQGTVARQHATVANCGDSKLVNKKHPLFSWQMQLRVYGNGVSAV